MTTPRAWISTALMKLTSQLKPPSERQWRVMLIDPDGVPSGEVFLLDIQQAARLVTLLRRQMESSARP